MMKAEVRRIVIGLSDEVLSQGAVAGSTAHEARHPAFGHKGQHIPPCLCSVPGGRLTRSGILPTHIMVSGRFVQGATRSLSRASRADSIRPVIICSVGIHVGQLLSIYQQALVRVKHPEWKYQLHCVAEGKL